MSKETLVKSLQAICLVVFVGWARARPAVEVKAGRSKEVKDHLRASEQDMQRWRDMKFGLFVHWGPVSLMGTEIGWSRGGERRGRKGRGEIPVEVYDSLYLSFYPSRFDAKEWVRIAQEAGMRYLVFTTKHHDGFCMFDSRLTEYKISNSPFKRDIVRELADACHEAGLKLGFYYSQPDYHHPDYRTENHARYIKYLHEQIRELCTNYGRVDIIFFDGLGGKAEDWNSETMFKIVRQLQPHVVIDNRAGLPGDYDTPEQHIGKFQRGRAWETCMTIGDQWAWKTGDNVKTLKQCIQTLVRVVGGDGNFLFNVGPMPTGEIEPRQVAILKGMGEWLRKYGEGIYGTRGGPFKSGAWGASTCRGNRVYLHILNWHGERFFLPPIDRKVIGTSLLTGGQLDIKQNQNEITLKVPEEYHREIDTVVVLDLDGPASEIEPLSVPSRSLAYGKNAGASGVYRNRAENSADQAFDDDYSSLWRSDGKEGWLEVDLGCPQTVSTAVVHQGSDYFGAEEFELLCKVGEKWQILAEGTKLGQPAVLKFEPVRAQVFRLKASRRDRQLMICEFQLFGPER